MSWGVFVLAYAAAGLSQLDALIPDGTTPISAFLTSPTRTDTRVNATRATFAETVPDQGMWLFYSIC